MEIVVCCIYTSRRCVQSHSKDALTLTLLLHTSLLHLHFMVTLRRKLVLSLTWVGRTALPPGAHRPVGFILLPCSPSVLDLASKRLVYDLCSSYCVDLTVGVKRRDR